MSEEKILDLTPYNLVRPFRIEWIYSYDSQDILSGVKSKSTRKVLRNFSEVLSRNGLQYQLIPLTAALYSDWLGYYGIQMTKRGHDIIAKNTWFEQSQERNLTPYLMEFTQHAQRVGAGIISSSPDKKWVFHFKASELIELTGEKNLSLGALMEYLFIKTAHDQDASLISSGKSRNAFGFYNTFGYLNAKTRFGYTGVVAENTDLEHTVPYHSGKEVGFYAVANSDIKETTFNLFTSQNEINSELRTNLQYVNYTLKIIP